MTANVDMAQGELSGKRGKPFERVVKEVLSTLDPRSVVRQGQWVTGPDGRRELDVLIEGSVEGVRRRVLVECKDFNPNTTGPVGIRFVDALESKRRDLAADVSFICSNAGFTTDAIRKAKRVGIGLIAVLRERDHRIRFQVREEIYIRRVTVQTLTIGLQTEPAVKLDGVPRFSFLMESYWSSPDAEYAPNCSTDSIQERISEKASKFSAYASAFPECWLLVVADDFRLSGRFQFPQKTLEHVYSSPFSQAYLLEPFSSRVHPLKSRPVLQNLTSNR